MVQEGQDDRNHCQLRESTLELLRVRNGFLTDQDLTVNHVLDTQQMKDIWNYDLKIVFLEEEDAFLSGPPPAKKAKHARFNAWLRWAYGKKDQIQKLLQHGIQNRRMLHMMETKQWHV